MTNVYDAAAAFSRQLRRGTEPPDNGEMETRVAKIEDHLNQLDGRLTRVEVKIDHIDKEVSNFKWWLIGAIVTVMLTVLGTSIGIQQMTVATFQGAAQVAKDAAPAPVVQPAPQPIIITIPQGHEVGNGRPAPAPTKP